MNESGFNFIVGIGRSGTTLLMSMLNAHPTIQATPEVNFFVFFYNSWKNKKTFSEKDFETVDAYVQLFKRRKHASGFDWSLDLFKEHIKGSENINFATIYQCFYRAFIYAGTIKNITHNFDKNPINTLFLNEIIEQLPNSKFVFLVRDPRANYLSRKEKVNFRKSNLYADSHRWAMYNQSIFLLMEKHKDKFYVLKYEDLVSDPAFYLSELSRFFEFNNDDAMLNFHKLVKENSLKKVIDDSSNVHEKAKEKYEKLSRPIN
ncbi:MAG: sulfotransferase, partial [Bacteroidota bacterium]